VRRMSYPRRKNQKQSSYERHLPEGKRNLRRRRRIGLKTKTEGKEREFPELRKSNHRAAKHLGKGKKAAGGRSAFYDAKIFKRGQP